jgi:hypothetical protein
MTPQQPYKTTTNSQSAPQKCAKCGSVTSRRAPAGEQVLCLPCHRLAEPPKRLSVGLAPND